MPPSPLVARKTGARRNAWQRAGALTIETVLGFQGKQDLHLFVVSTSDLGHNCCFWNSAARRTGSRPRDRVSPAKAGSDILAGATQHSARFARSMLG
jgi:hypothetical protein